ncbi:MAG: hypothetical protein EBY22_02940 [Gammaproteobacteria bacterium]|jgi:hypothetical protein|nr:hypothetical protein [Gammaproteobacteria bacterium]
MIDVAALCEKFITVETALEYAKQKNRLIWVAELIDAKSVDDPRVAILDDYFWEVITEDSEYYME